AAATVRARRDVGSRTSSSPPKSYPKEKSAVIRIPVLRWGEPYESLETDKVVHFITGEVLAEVGRANAAMVERDMRYAQRARDVLREIPIADLLQMMKKAGELYAKAELPLGDGTQTPDQFARMQSATTGLPEPQSK